MNSSHDSFFWNSWGSNPEQSLNVKQGPKTWELCGRVPGNSVVCVWLLWHCGTQRLVTTRSFCFSWAATCHLVAARQSILLLLLLYHFGFQESALPNKKDWRNIPHRSMLLENFKPDNFPYSINLVSSVLIKDTVLPSRGRVLRKYAALSIFV